MAESSQPHKHFLIFPILSIIFIFSMFYRVSNAVISPNLIQDLGLNAESLGILGGAFFYSFALLQIPIGPMLDRIGPRIVMGSFTLLGAFGAFLFALADSFTPAFLGRLMIGAGMACGLMGPLKVFVLYFPPKKFAMLMGIFLSTGALGSMLAASPLAYLTSALGWRTTFVLAGGITTLLSFMVFWVLGGEKKKEEVDISSHSPDLEMGILQSIRLVLGSLTFWQMGTVAFFRYGTFVGLQGLWLGPYLIHIKGYSSIQAGNLLIFLAIGTIIGSPFAGQLSDRMFHSTKSVILGGLIFYFLSLFPLIGVLKIQESFWYSPIFFSIGFSWSFGMLLYSHAKELFPITISGTVMTWINFFTMAGAAIFMPALGKLIESFPRTGSSYPAEAYHFSFLICFICMAVSLVFYAFSKKEKQRDLKNNYTLS
mgnify:CR=1 FL=1